MEIAAITSAIILAYIQSTSTTHVNLNSTNSMTLNHTVRIPKCCKENTVMTEDGCMKNTQYKFLPSVKVLIHNSTHVNDDPVIDAKFDSFVQNIDCPIGSYALRPEEDIFYLLENGSLVLTNQHRLLSPTQFCFESVDIGDDYEKWNTTAFICAPLSSNKDNFVLFIIYFVGLLASSVALLTTVCAISRNNFITTCCHFLRNTVSEKKQITLYCTLLLSSYAMVAVAQIVQSNDSTCDVLGTLYYAFLIAAIGCLSLMAADTYSHVRSYGRNTERCSGSIQPSIKPIIILITITFMLMVILLVYLDVISAPRMFLKPQLGQNSCWYTGKKSAAFFFILPVVSQVIPNLILLSLSRIFIKRQDITYSKEMDWELLKDMNFACFLLIILTMVVWTGELTLLLFDGVTKLSLPLDIIECLQGVLVFFFFRRIRFQSLEYNSPNNSDYDCSRNTSDSSIEPMV